MQKITIIGRLGRNVSVRETENGSKVLGFTVAVNSRVRGIDKTSWYDVSTFNYDRYKNMVPYLTKGSSVIVVGDLDADIEEGKDGKMRCRRAVIADCIDFNSNGSSGSTVSNQATTTSRSSEPADSGVPADEEIEVTAKPRRKAAAPKVTEPVEETPVSEGADGDDLPF